MPTAIRSDKIFLSSEKKTEELAGKFLKKLKPGNIVFLYGEIGVGKTTFIRYLINGYQKENKVELTEVTSPTFNLVNEYDVVSFIIQHYDLYRIINSEEIKNIGLLEDYEELVTLIEWPEKIKKKVNNKIDLFFEYGEDMDKRFLSIKGLDYKKLNAIR